MAFNNTIVARAAAGIWGLKLGNGTMNTVLAQVNSGTSLSAIINSAFNDSYPASTSNSTIADMVVANLGLTGTAATNGKAYIVDQLSHATTATRGSTLADIINLFSTLSGDATYGSFATAFNAKVAAAAAYSSTAGTPDAVLGNLDSGTSFSLTTGQDNLTATSANDTFKAYIFDNQNTLQSGDYVDGGLGIDTLYADMGGSQNFAVTPILKSIETVQIRAQSKANESGDNNTSGEGRVDVDFERVSGVTRIESNNSRADLIVEDVRILSSQITKDVTIAFVDSDPGNVDYGVYFDQASLRAGTNSSATLDLQVMDITAAANSATSATPLLNSPYDGISFSIDGVGYLIQSDTINNATTYDALLTAIQTQLTTAKVISTGATVNLTTTLGVTAALAGTFDVYNSATGQTVQGIGRVIQLSANGHTFAIGNWIASAGVPALSNLWTQQIIASSSSEDLVTSTIVLDNVGRGSNGGDLVVGGLSVGETSQSKGVDRFEITVERTSRVQNVDSTNNWLKEVTIKNGTATGDVYILGTAVGNVGSDNNNALPGNTTTHDTWGFNDVRLIDASAMTGKVTFDAVVSPASFNKYIKLSDTGSNPAGDNTSVPTKTTQVADFIYSGGTNNDSINVQIDGGIAASNSNVMVGREDFTFRVNGNAGDDALTLRIIDSELTGNSENWYGNQKMLRNVTIDGGTGNDTIRKPGAGDVIILAGDGTDTIYADNSGAQLVNNLVPTTIPSSSANVNPYYLSGASNAYNGVYVFNTDNAGVTATNPVTPAVARELADLRSDANDSYNLYKATVTVNFKGLTKSIVLPTGQYAVTDLYINQAIKDAINNDPVLSKLLLAVDGPAYSLVVKSLIDGDQTGDLSIAVKAATATDFSAAELAAVISAYGLASTATAADVQAEFTAALATYNTNADYGTSTLIAGVSSTAVANLGKAATIDVAGANSTSTSDNTITPGAGNDVVVLGTTVGADALHSSNDVVVYSGTFGNDTIVNFVAGAVGAVFDRDQLNFAALGGRASGTVTNDVTTAGKASGGTTQNDKSIIIDEVITTSTGATSTDGNTTLLAVQAYFTDTGNTTALTHVVVVVDPTTNIGTVYSVTDAVGGTGAAPNITATLSGTIDLADTLWSTLVASNFT